MNMNCRKNIMIVFGTRPEAIKMSVLTKLLQGREDWDVRVCVTAQHREMLDQVLSFFKIKPDFDLNLMNEAEGLADLTGLVISRMQKIFNIWRPDVIFVHGDTLTTMATSLVAYYNKISVLHVEAGLRTYNKYSPWPEEINRRIVASIADLHFAPTDTAKNNLMMEGIDENKIFTTGNTVIDALAYTVNGLEKDAHLNTMMVSQFNWIDKNKKLILLTCHRRENFGERASDILEAIKEIAKKEDVQIVIPVHPNPNIFHLFYKELSEVENIFLIPPQDYLQFVFLMRSSYIILTDSGGVQEEAPFLNKPILVIRDTTERPEVVVAGAARLVGVDSQEIVRNVELLLTDPDLYNRMSLVTNPYGQGDSSEKIYDIFSEYFK